ncbi:MAG TPA: hypothetical protein VI636_14820 [Candidatus Angelobacter sp.]
MHPHSPAPWKIIPVLLLATGLVVAAIQQEKKQEPKPEEKPAAAPQLSASARLAAAKTAFLRKTGNGDNAAYDVVSSTLEGWGRFTLVNSPDKADIIVEIFSVSEIEGGITASAGSEGSKGRERAVGRSIVSQIKLTVYDPKSKVPLWIGLEHPKSAMKKTDRENNEVEAAERLVQKFHDQIEPSAK